MIIDRIEGEYAIVETENGQLILPIQKLPYGCKEGMEITETEDGYKIIDNAARRAHIRQKMHRLFKQD